MQDISSEIDERRGSVPAAENSPTDILPLPYVFNRQVIVITGGAGVLGGEIANALLRCGALVAIIDRNPALAEHFGTQLPADELKERLLLLTGDVLDRQSLELAQARILDCWGRLDALVNAAGGNNPDATTSAQKSFFDLPETALRFVSDLNLLGTMLPCQVFGKTFARQQSGAILNIASMNAFRPLTRIPAYSAAKAAVVNFTQWLAVHMATEYAPAIRVNAIAPGFFLTEQNRFLLTEKESGELTARGRQILAHTPMGRFGSPSDLVGGSLWLLSPLAAFVTGIVLPIDGGFAAYSGV